jgi:hypothetical protein
MCSSDRVGFFTAVIQLRKINRMGHLPPTYMGDVTKVKKRNWVKTSLKEIISNTCKKNKTLKCILQKEFMKIFVHSSDS